MSRSDFNDLAHQSGLTSIRKRIDLAQPITPEAIDWPEPQPIIEKLPEVATFHLEQLLPAGCLRLFVQDEAERMGASIDFIAASLVVSLGSALGARCAIQPKQHDHRQVVANLWGAVVGNPGSKKSSAIHAPLKFVEELERSAHETFQKELKNFKVEKTFHETRFKTIESKMRHSVDRKDDSSSALNQLKNELLSLQTNEPQSLSLIHISEPTRPY